MGRLWVTGRVILVITVILLQAGLDHGPFFMSIVVRRLAEVHHVSHGRTARVISLFPNRPLATDHLIVSRKFTSAWVYSTNSKPLRQSLTSPSPTRGTEPTSLDDIVRMTTTRQRSHPGIKSLSDKGPFELKSLDLNTSPGDHRISFGRWCSQRMSELTSFNRTECTSEPSATASILNKSSLQPCGERSTRCRIRRRQS